MKRYDKTYSSKWQNRYSEEFKRMVCNDFMTGSLSLREVERKFKLGNSRLNIWLKELGYTLEKKRYEVILPPMPDISKTNISDKEFDKLRKELEDAKLLAESYKKMIEIAESELNIPIRKKSNTK